MLSSMWPERNFTRYTLHPMVFLFVYFFLAHLYLWLIHDAHSNIQKWYLHSFFFPRMSPSPLFLTVHSGLHISTEGVSNEKEVHATGTCPHFHACSGQFRMQSVHYDNYLKTLSQSPELKDDVWETSLISKERRKLCNSCPGCSWLVNPRLRTCNSSSSFLWAVLGVVDLLTLVCAHATALHLFLELSWV